MQANNRMSLAEFLESRRHMKAAWDTFHRQAFRQTLIHSRLAVTYLLHAVVLLEGDKVEGDILDRFFESVKDILPLDKAGNFMAILHAPELKPMAPVHRGNLDESISSWLVTKKISRSRAFEFLSQAQDTVNLTIRLMEKKYPFFFKELS